MRRFSLLFVLVACLPLAAFSQTGPNRASLETWGARPFPGAIAALPLSIVGDTSLPARLSAALEATYALTPAKDKHGVAASAIVPGYPQWTGAAGTSDGVTAMSPALSFEIGSCTKTFIAALILELRDEGKLALTDSISKFLPSFPNVDSTITIEELLDHSSGLYDYLNDDPSTRLLNDAYLVHPSKQWTPIEILDSFVGPENFKPGTGYRYSNTDYLLLGLIADSITHETAATAIHARFLSKLGMTHTLCSWEDSIPGNFPHNYSNYMASIQGCVDYDSIDKTAQLRVANTAGGMVSVPAELARWSEALYTGQILGASTTAQMLDVSQYHLLTQGFYYNLGTMLEGRAYDGQYIYGHFGSMVGYVTGMATIPHDSVTVVVYVNSLTDTIIAADYVNAMIYQIEHPAPSAVSQAPEISEAAFVSPNPAQNLATISYMQNTAGSSRITLFDNLGKRVRTVRNPDGEIGRHEIALDCTGLAAGAYHYRLDVPHSSASGLLLIAQ